jgi:hypothetical protein
MPPGKVPLIGSGSQLELIKELSAVVYIVVPAIPPDDILIIEVNGFIPK